MCVCVRKRERGKESESKIIRRAPFLITSPPMYNSLSHSLSLSFFLSFFSLGLFESAQISPTSFKTFFALLFQKKSNDQ